MGDKMINSNIPKELLSQSIENASQSLEVGSCNAENIGLHKSDIGNDATNTMEKLDIMDSSSKGGRLKSVVWNHFIKIKSNGVQKAQCNYCKKLLGANSKNGTKHLHQHIDICFQRKIKMRGQTILTSRINKGKSEMTAQAYDPEVAKNELVNAIIMHEYPLSIVDHTGFRKYSGALQPLFNVPSRNTIKKEIIKIYDLQKTPVLEIIDNNEGRVAITSDMWTSSNQKRGYMAITAHYIDSSWILQSHILRFVYVPAPHTSDKLCYVLVGCLMDWNIDTKLSTITLDNCSTNDSMIRKIKEKLHSDNLLLNGSLLHMRCCAHILNLIVKDGVENIRDSVAYWTATPKRMERFKDTAKQLRITYTKNLCLDCPTRWNSTYKMLENAISYKEVFYRLRQRDDKYSCLPTATQWDFAKEVCGKIKIFSTIIKLFSGTSYPTANLYFPKVCEINVTISSWLTHPNVMIQNMATKMMDKFKCYWTVIHDIMGVATVLDPRYKLSLLEYYYRKLYQDDATIEINRIRQLCYNLVSEYQSRTSSKQALINQVDKDDDSIMDDSLNDFDAFVASQKRAKVSYIKTELDLYLEEDVLPRSNSFDILLWWKLNGVKYPILQAIAKDVLAIPISTVTSESAFSTGGRIISPHRSRLHWHTLEALMCARSWLWSKESKGLHQSANAKDEFENLLDDMDFEDEDDATKNGATFGLEED